jgi:hypothetical protein
VAVALTLILGFALLGLFGGSSTHPGSSEVSFSAARATATSGVPSGPWALESAIGIGPANTTTFPINLTAETNCTVTSFSGPLPSSLTIPTFQGNFAAGVVPEWLFSFGQASTGAELAVAVSGGVPVLQVELSGPNCATGVGEETPIPNTIVDSPAAASAAYAAGGEAYLQNHSTGVSLDMVLIDFTPMSSTPAVLDWDVLYSTCSLLETTGNSQNTGVAFSAAVNATTGVVVPGSNTTESCGVTPSPGIGSALTLGPATLIVGPGSGGTLAGQGCTSGDYCYEVPIVSAADNVAPNDFDAAVATSNDTIFPSVGFAVTNVAGQVVVYAPGPVESSWTPGVGNPGSILTSTMSIVVDLGTSIPSGQNWFLMVTGTGPFAGSTLDYGLP